MTTKNVTTPDDIVIAAQEWGNPQGPEILFLHGFNQCHLSWQRQYADPALAAKFHGEQERSHIQLLLEDIIPGLDDVDPRLPSEQMLERAVEQRRRMPRPHDHRLDRGRGDRLRQPLPQPLQRRFPASGERLAKRARQSPGEHSAGVRRRKEQR